ncbi:MAG: hypothetical protein P8J87_02785, partial [Verrucomicrobiales bacterium]|nr:hypothetical protein [Verrucomicrobiales bacterium]
MSDEEMDDAALDGVRIGAEGEGVRQGSRKGGSAVGTAVVVGAGALLAGRVLGGGLLTGIAGVVAGTIAGKAMASRRRDPVEVGDGCGGAVEEVAEV